VSKIESVKWAGGARFKVGADVALDCLEKIREENDGSITADGVVEEAEKEESPIHEEFEWSDSIAAHEHRKYTARTMIRSLHVVREEAPNVEARQYELRVATKDKAIKSGIPQRCYRTTEDILADPIERDRLIARAVQDLATFRSRYAGLSELAVVFSAIDDVAAA